jgi:hypothetical protein
MKSLLVLIFLGAITSTAYAADVRRPHSACGHIVEGQECAKDIDYSGTGKIFVCLKGRLQFANKYCNNGRPSCGLYPNCNMKRRRQI